MIKRRVAAVLAWIVALVATFAGFSLLLRVSPVADDLATFSVGIGFIWDQWHFGDYSRYLLQTLADGNHFLPMGALFTSVYVSLAVLLGKSPLGLENAWNVMRILMIITSLLSVTFFLKIWLRMFERTSPLARFSSLTIYALVSAVTISTIEVHAVWSNDPVVSYPLAGWGTVAIGFTYLGLLPTLAKLQGIRLVFASFGVGLLGVVGLLHYEMMLSAIVCAALVYIPILLTLTIRNRQWLRGAILSIGAVIVPLLAFLMIQVWRLSQPRDYNGTTIGYAALVLPVLKNGLLSTLPLAAVRMAQVTNNGLKFNLAWFVLITVSLAILIGLVFLDDRWVGSKPQRSLVLRPVVAILCALGVIAISSVAIFATSSKYQVEIGQELGHVYLNYAFGVLCISATVALAVLMGITYFGRKILLPLGVVLAVFSLISYMSSESSIEHLESERAWVSRLLNAVENTTVRSDGCQLIEPLYAPDVPDWYRSAVIDGLSNATFADSGVPLCAHTSGSS